MLHNVVDGTSQSKRAHDYGYAGGGFDGGGKNAIE